MRTSFASRNVKQPVARIERSDIRERSGRFNVHPGFRCAPPGLRERNKGSGTPADAVFHVPHASGARVAPRIKSACADPSAVGRARLPAFHHGFRQRDSSSLRLSFRPGFLGRGLNGCYLRLSQPRGAPPTPVIVPGDMMPKPPESGGDEAPPAGTALTPADRHHRTASLRASFDSLNCIRSDDKCQHNSDNAATPVSRARRSMERSGMVRCRPGIVTTSEPAAIPDQRCTTTCCIASGRRCHRFRLKYCTARSGFSAVAE
jgi:hypothetical protein